MSEDIPSERHAGIVIKQRKILLMHRIKNGYEYYVLPGGHRTQGEIGEQTVVREVYEETGITVNHPKLVLEQIDHLNNHKHVVYWCNWVEGEKPQLLGEEKNNASQNNFFGPGWFELDTLRELNIVPVFTKDWLEANYLNSAVTLVTNKEESAKEEKYYKEG